MSEPKRQLAAIMFTDMVGYTRQMGADESKALRLVEENQSIHRELIPSHNGSLLKEMGDGNLASFDSVSDAIQCALNMQEKLRDHNDITLRIGIHLGEVIFRDDDVFGDGVNIASRLETIAEPGGIYISGSVQQAIRSKKEIEYDYLGEKQLKNVDFPIKVYGLKADYLPVPKSSADSGSKKGKLVVYSILGLLAIATIVTIWKFSEPGSSKVQQDEMKLAIIPFTDISGNEEMAHLGFGFATSIRSKLSLTKKFYLLSAMQATMGYANTLKSPSEIGEELTVNYLLTGLYQVAQDRIKVDVEFVDATSGASVWNLSYDEPLKDIFQVQSKIANSVLNNFELSSISDESPTTNIEAYAYYTQGITLRSTMQAVDSADLAASQHFFELAIQLDSTFQEAWVGLINNETSQIWFGRKLDRGLTESHVKEFERRFPDSYRKNLVRGLYTYRVDLRYDEAYKYFEEVLEEDPENSVALGNFAAIQKRMLLHSGAVTNFTKLIERNQAAHTGWMWEELGIVFWKMGDYQSAELCFKKAIELGRRAIGLLRQMQIGQGLRLEENSDNDVEEQLDIKLQNRDYEEILEIVDKIGISEAQALRWKTWVHLFQDNVDSARYYAGKLHELDSSFLQFQFLRDREEVWQELQKGIERNKSYGDHMDTCELTMRLILFYALVGEYEKATETLVQLNGDYPAWGAYLVYTNRPHFDKIKKEYPPFVEALNNLKLPPKLDLEGFIEL